MGRGTQFGRMKNSACLTTVETAQASILKTPAVGLASDVSGMSM